MHAAFSQETLQSLAGQFAEPKDEYKPQAWWHWLGTNYSKAGMTADLEAMKRAGVNGVVVFNAPSWLDTAQNLYKNQAYRSEPYWDALRHALTEARRLKMTVGLHNSPGWSTTGGPWITPEMGMQRVAWSVTELDGVGAAAAARALPPQALPLPNPADELKNINPKWFKDIAVFAVASDASEIVDISGFFKDGALAWSAPAGRWKIYRLGYLPTMQRSHPTPEDVEKTAFEVDKMSAALTRFHWDNVLNPLTERFGDFIGATFTIIWTDSYEAWGQSWSAGFRNDFIKIKGYDPARQLALALARGEEIFDEASFHLKDPAAIKYAETKRFVADYADVISRLYLACFRLGREMINQAGFQHYWEPYGSIIDAPFDMEEGEGIADVPATEFWVHSLEPSGGGRFAEAAAKYSKRIVAAEAFTGMEATCTFNETPAMLKPPADMAFCYGVNQLFLHSWAHNPLPDKYQPGWNFAHYGTHFSRNQTWIEPAKAFFTYLARCQMLLQQGTFVARSENVLHRSTPEAEIFFVRNTGDRFENRSFTFNVKNGKPQLWNAYTGKIAAAKTAENGDVLLSLEKNESVFVVMPNAEGKIQNAEGKIQNAEGNMQRAEARQAASTQERTIAGKWRVTFIPKTGEKPFTKTFDKLVDFSRQSDFSVKYFSGTAVYENSFRCKMQDANGKAILDLGTVYNMAEVEVNGKPVGVLWIAPFKVDVTGYVKAGNNTLKIKVTNTWQNRLIGDEQFPADFAWLTLENDGEPARNGLPRMKGLPDWVRNDTPRPSKERKTFIPWSYFDKNSELAPAGMTGEVKLIYCDRHGFVRK
ncbi:MAG: hypothetical protein LBG47_10495 [Prevotellaceae bacterium]|nr:hypothetical protein [Prevotellaceae bacterium]